jgi:hypothetical protein
MGPRATLLGATNALENVNTTPLPNGSLCWVTGEQDLFVLVKTSTAAADGTNVIEPIAGPGRWFRFSQAPGAASTGFGSTIDTQAGPEFTTVGTTPSDIVGADIWVERDSQGFSFDGLGTWTYEGSAAALFHVVATLAILNVESGTRTILFTYKINDTYQHSSGLFQQVGVANAAEQVFTITDLIELTPGDTLNIAVRTSTGDSVAVLNGQFTGAQL